MVGSNTAGELGGGATLRRPDGVKGLNVAPPEILREGQSLFESYTTNKLQMLKRGSYAVTVANRTRRASGLNRERSGTGSGPFGNLLVTVPG